MIMQKTIDYNFTYEDGQYFYLYKHVPFSDGSLCIIKDGTLKFTPPSEFNDPFGCVYGITENHFQSSSELKRLFERHGWDSISPARRIDLARRSKFLQSKAMDDGSYFENFYTKFGICCLNHNPLNILMWSHYADNHRGILIEFKFSKKELNSDRTFQDFYPIPVVYSESLPLISREDRYSENPTLIMQKTVLTKAIDWGYEKEFRILKHGIESAINEYPSQRVLSSIVCGYKMKQESIQIVNDLAKLANIEVYKARRIPNSYGITVPDHPRLDVIASSKKNK